jgi:Kef-type K+ transport system membrane component KefB
VSAAARKPVGARLLEAALLVAVFGLLWLATWAAPEIHGGLGTIAAVGSLLLAGTLASELVEVLGVPHLTGYLVAGIVAGPYVLALIDLHTVERLAPVNALALSLIALEGGAELKLDVVRRGLRSLSLATLLQSLGVMAVMTGVFLAARPLVPFARALPLSAAAGIALLWGVMSITRSPSATLGILSQTRAAGPLSTYTLTFVMASDLVVVVLLAAALTVAHPLLSPGATFSPAAFHTLGHEVLGSVALGTTLGLLLAAYLRLVGKQLVLLFVAIGFGLTEMLHYLRFEPLLTFMVAGFLVQNLSKQGEKFLHALHQTGGVVYVVFFATAGAELNVPLLRQLWMVAVLLAVARAGSTLLAGRLASRLAGDDPVVKRWGWSGMISQAGLALGLAGVVAREFPTFGAGFRSLAIATVALNEMIGPILFKLALDRSGETQGPEPSIPEPAEAAS